MYQGGGGAPPTVKGPYHPDILILYDFVLARAQVPTLFAMPRRRLQKQRMAVFL